VRINVSVRVGVQDVKANPTHIRRERRPDGNTLDNHVGPAVSVLKEKNTFPGGSLFEFNDGFLDLFLHC